MEASGFAGGDSLSKDIAPSILFFRRGASRKPKRPAQDALPQPSNHTNSLSPTGGAAYLEAASGT